VFLMMNSANTVMYERFHFFLLYTVLMDSHFDTIRFHLLLIILDFIRIPITAFGTNLSFSFVLQCFIIFYINPVSFLALLQLNYRYSPNLRYPLIFYGTYPLSAEILGILLHFTECTEYR